MKRRKQSLADDVRGSETCIVPAFVDPNKNAFLFERANRRLIWASPSCPGFRFSCAPDKRRSELNRSPRVIASGRRQSAYIRQLHQSRNAPGPPGTRLPQSLVIDDGASLFGAQCWGRRPSGQPTNREIVPRCTPVRHCFGAAQYGAERHLIAAGQATINAVMPLLTHLVSVRCARSHGKGWRSVGSKPLFGLPSRTSAVPGQERRMSIPLASWVQGQV